MSSSSRIPEICPWLRCTKIAKVSQITSFAIWYVLVLFYSPKKLDYFDQVS